MGLNLGVSVVNVSVILCYKCSLNLYLQHDQHLKGSDKFFAYQKVLI